MNPPVTVPSTGRREEEWYVRRLLAAALLMAAFLSLWWLDGPLQGSEGRWATVVTEMMKSGDYFRMTIAGAQYPDKPFGSYWLIALTAALTGNLNEWATRLPGALSFILTTGLVFAIGKRTVGALPAALAACIFATTFQLVLFSRVASADPQTVLGVALAMLLILEASEAPRWWYLPVLGTVMGITSLMKGLGGAAVPAFAACLWALAVRGVAWVRPVPTLLALLAFVMTLGVPLAIPWLTRGDTGPLVLLWRESVTRGLDPFDHVQPWYFYFWNQFVLLAPWSVLLPAALLTGWLSIRRQLRAGGGSTARVFARSEDRRRIFPLFAYLAIFLLFTLSGSRRTYYLLPLAPFFSLMVAEALLDSQPGWTAGLRKWALTVLAIVGIALGVTAVALGMARLASPQMAPALLDYRGQLVAKYWQAIPVGIILVGACVPLAILLLKRIDDRLRALAPAIALTFVILAGVIGTMEPLRAQALDLQEFCAAVRRIVPDGEAIDVDWRQADDPSAVPVTDAPKLLFYLGRPFAQPGAPPTRFLIVDQQQAEQMLAREPGAYLRRTVEPSDPLSRSDRKAEAQRRVLLERLR